MAQSYGHNNNRVVNVSIFNLCLHTTMLVSGRQTFPIVQIHSNELISAGVGLEYYIYIYIFRILCFISFCVLWIPIDKSLQPDP